MQIHACINTYKHACIYDGRFICSLYDHSWPKTTTNDQRPVRFLFPWLLPLLDLLDEPIFEANDHNLVNSTDRKLLMLKIADNKNLTQLTTQAFFNFRILVLYNTSNESFRFKQSLISERIQLL